MRVGAVKVATFYNESITTLRDDINKFLSGQTVVGPPAYVEGTIKSQELVSIEFRADGATYSAMITYAE